MLSQPVIIDEVFDESNSVHESVMSYHRSRRHGVVVGAPTAWRDLRALERPAGREPGLVGKAGL